MEYTTGSVRLKRHLRPADATEIIEEEAQPHTYRYAGFWMRFWAFIVDLLIITGLNGVLVSTWVPLIADGDSRWAFFCDGLLTTECSLRYCFLSLLCVNDPLFSTNARKNDFWHTRHII